ncbi:MAG: bifunctional UDP-sugar hydrolase/5'-nucleotidase [bacterium]|nr:bifunctional UDP-sugar hydrolase/5'-nucleotidase [bacterium]
MSISARRLRPAAAALAFILLAAAVPSGGAGDVGAQPDPVRLHLIWTNDVHGHIAPEPARFMNPSFPPPLGGGASLANYLAGVREAAAAAGEDVLVVDVGDFFQGTPVGSKTKGDAVMAYFEALRYDVIVPGNHDFDMGRDNTERLANGTRIPFVCANLRDAEDGEIVDWCVPTLMLERAGLKIGVIGVITTGTEYMSFPANIEGLIFDPMVPVIETWRDRLRADGADLVFLLIHEGLPFDPQEGWRRIAGAGGEAETGQSESQGGTYGTVTGGATNLMEIVNAVEGIDVAVGGHTHRGYEQPWIDPMTHTLCFESFGNGSSVGHAILEIDPATGTLLGYDTPHDRGVLITLFEDELWPDPAMRRILQPYIAKTDAEMGKVVGSAAVNLTRGDPGASLMGNLVTDAMREYFDADFSFQNLGGLRADVPAGNITARDVFSVLPFGNELVVVKMPGSLIRTLVERKVAGDSGGICVSGIRMRYNKQRPDGDRVCELEIAGAPLDPERTYRVVTTTFLMEGNSGLDFLTTVPAGDIELTQITIDASLEQYLQRHSPVRPRVDDRWVEDVSAVQAPYLARPPAAD